MAADWRLRQMLEDTTLLAAIITEDDLIIFANPALSKLAGLTPAQVEGRTWTEVFGPNSQEDINFMEMLRQGNVIPTYDGIISTPTGVHVIAWTNTPIWDDSGAMNIASLGEDVTARRAAEDQLAAAHAERLELQAAIFAAEAAERARIAEALHDDTIQVITAALLNLDRMAGPSDDPVRELTRTNLAAALERARRLLFELRPPELDQHGMLGAITSLCQHVQAEIGCQLSLDVVDRRFPSHVEELVFRTVREAVLNARRHSGAALLQVVVADRGAVLDCLIIDDGEGFDPLRVARRPDAGRHLGLAAMAERVHLAHGVIEVRSAPGSGTTIAFQVPTS